MAFSGLWRNTATTHTDQYTAPLGAADPERHMELWDESAHGVDDTAETRRGIDTRLRFDYAEPTLTDTSDTASAPPDRPNVPYDNEPGDHNAFTRPQSRGDYVPPSALHSRDLGSYAAREYDVQTQEQYDQRYETERFTPNTTVSYSTAALTRGVNSLAQNNPVDTVQRTRGLPPGASAPRVGWQGSPRPGLRVQRWSTRKIPMHRWTGDIRPLRVNTAKTAGASPALADGNQYRTPFSDLVPSRLKNQSVPVLRREPRPWDETAVTDGSETVGSESIVRWGL